MELFNPAYLVHLAAILYIAAFLVRDELLLRGLALAGSVFYLLYYFLAPDIPLWDAIFTGSLLICANMFIMGRIILERTVFGLSHEEKGIFERFGVLTPGQFRRLLKLGERHIADGSETLTRQGEAPSRLHYIIGGAANGTKDGRAFSLGCGSFIGEIAFVMEDHVASADVRPQSGMDYLSWNAEVLRAHMEKSLPFKNAMIALLSRDLASKLASSFKSGAID